jgi:propionate CoA-transferase
MFQIMTAAEAARFIEDHAVIGLNSFAAMANPEKLHDAITQRFRETGHPRGLTLISSAGFGLLDPDRGAEPYIREGAVSKIIASHYGTLPVVRKLVLEDRFEAYNLPLGPMSHALRAQAGGHDGYFTRTGLGIFVDPRVEGPGLNSISKDESLVRLVTIEGEEYLRYHLPAPTIACFSPAASTIWRKALAIEGSISAAKELSSSPEGSVSFSRKATICRAAGRKRPIWTAEPS